MTGPDTQAVASSGEERSGLDPLSPVRRHSALRASNQTRPLVAFVTNVYRPHLGGISSYVSSLAGLTLHGIETNVLSYPARLVDLEGSREKVKLFFPFHLLFVMGALAVLLLHRLRGRKIIVHSHSASFCLLVGFVGKTFGMRAVHTFHSPISRPSRILRWLVPRLDAVVFVSPALRDLYHETIEAENAREEIIPGAVTIPPALEQVRPQARVNVRQSLGLPPAAAIVLYVGRVVPEKGVHVLTKAISLMQEASVAALIVGPPGSRQEDRAYWTDISTSQPLHTGSLHLLGAVPEALLDELYMAADVVVIPSLWPEPAPMVALEALAHSCPVVASETGGIPYLVPDDAGILVPPGDPESLSRALLRILGEPGLRERLSAGAARAARVQNSLERFETDHLKLYGSLGPI